MKEYWKIVWGLVMCGCGLLSGCSSGTETGDDIDGQDENTLPEKGTVFADFETYDTTPYFFRYGNNVTAYTNYEYYPRWIYSHTVVDNPLKNESNSSSKVLEYTSMEARNYGLKFRFSEALDIDGLKGIRFQIYQPANVIGKTTWKGTSAAISQQIAVKLIGSFNTVNDFKQESGILLANSLADFEDEGEWKTYTFTFSKTEYSAATTQLSDGIAGMVILPTYSSGVTLAEENAYKCYIDNIEIL